MAAVLVGIGGGSGSGKSTLAAALVRRFGEQDAVVIPHDAYYRDLAHLPLAERALANFDHPEALDNERLVADLARLRAGRAILQPRYDFRNHARQPDVIRVEPRRLEIVEGILVLAIEALCGVLDFKVFVDASAETRMNRRLARDAAERGRSQAQGMAQYHRTTLPMHERFIAPSQQRAHLTVSGDGDLAVAVATTAARIRDLMPS